MLVTGRLDRVRLERRIARRWWWLCLGFAARPGGQEEPGHNRPGDDDTAGHHAAAVDAVQEGAARAVGQGVPGAREAGLGEDVRRGDRRAD